MKRFDSLGVIVGKDIPDINKVEVLINELDKAFDKADLTKEEIVSIIKAYLPNFEHIEKGKSLDSKM